MRGKSLKDFILVIIFNYVGTGSGFDSWESYFIVITIAGPKIVKALQR